MISKLELTSTCRFAFCIFWMVRREKSDPKPNSLKLPILFYLTMKQITIIL